MSHTIDFFSFSPSRADENWKNLRSDILAARNAESISDEKADEIYQKTIAEFYAALKNKDLYIPWVEYENRIGIDEFGHSEEEWEVEDKIEYIFRGAPLYAHGVNPKENLDAVGYVLGVDFPEIFEKFEPLRFRSPKEIAIQKILGGMLFEVESDLEQLIEDYEAGNDDASSIMNLIMIDLKYGAIANDHFDSSDIFNEIMDALAEFCNFKTVEDLPAKDDLMRFFSTLNADIFQELVDFYAGYSHREAEEARFIIEDSLKSLRPVIRDLKETPDAIFIKGFDYIENITPESASDLLKERAEKHWRIIIEEKVLDNINLEVKQRERR